MTALSRRQRRIVAAALRSIHPPAQRTWTVRGPAAVVLLLVIVVLSAIGAVTLVGWALRLVTG